MFGLGKSEPEPQEPKKGEDDDATGKFVAGLSTPREIRKPIEVKDVEGKQKEHTADEYEIPYDPVNDADHPYEKWRKNRVWRLLMTREIARYLDRRTFITISVREAFFYAIFLGLVTIITFGSTPLDMFYFSQAMATLYTRQQFTGGNLMNIQFYDINTMADVWKYLDHVVEKLYNDFWYSKPDPYENPERTEEFFYENKLIGMPRLRQVRVQNDSCAIPVEMEHLIKNCYAAFSWWNEDTANFGVINSPYWKYRTNSENKAMSIDGSLATYGGGGYVAVLQRVGDKAVQTIEQLKHNTWLGRASRGLFLEFTIYNGNVNLFCIFKLIFEFPATGGVVPSHWNYVQKLIRYNDTYDTYVLVCEVFFTIFFLFYTFQKLLELKTLKMKLLKSFWNWIDIIILVMCYLVTIFNILLYIMVETQMPILVATHNEMQYASFDGMCYVHILYSYCFAILIAFAFFKILKYLNVVHAMYQLQLTISRATKDMLTYCVMFFYAYFVFAMVGRFLFGSKVEDYKTLPLAVFALMRSSVGDFNYHKLVQADPFCGPIFFFAFIFFIAFIMANMFLAILVSKYEEVRSEVRIGRAKTFIGDMIRFWLLRILEKAECHWLISQIERQTFEKKVRSPTEAIRNYLHQAGYSELEIELFFKKYDITDAKITAMDEDRVSSRGGEREAPNPLSQKDILRYIIIQKLEYLENHYKAANKLIDDFLQKLTKLETKKYFMDR